MVYLPDEKTKDEGPKTEGPLNLDSVKIAAIWTASR